jgi:flagellar biosynthesis/type III secretory pathway protein FliH
VRVGRARILKGTAVTARTSPDAPACVFRITREELEGRARAEVIVRDATERAEVILSEARGRAEAAAAEAAREAQAAEQAKLAAMFLAVKKADESRAERDLDRSVALAVALAERLIGASLELRPETIAGLARQALAEARGIRRARIAAHPLDVAPLQAEIATLGLPVASIEIRGDDTLQRGELKLHTDLGTLDARLTPRLERLAAALKGALR